MITPRNQQPQRSPEDDSEYRENYVAAEYINALYALDNGWTGKGVVVGVVDDGVREIGDLEGQINHDLSRDFGSEIVDNERVGPRREDGNTGDEESDHGTPVAAIIAGRNDGEGIQGLAPDVQIASLRVDSLINGGQQFMVTDEVYTWAIDNAIPILNQSLSRNNYGLFSQGSIDNIARYGASGGLVVRSAGNDGEENPNDYMDLTDETYDTLIFVVAVNRNEREYDISAYSNHCGVTMDRCVSAVGYNTTMGVDGDIIGFGGTSSAAPQVSALAAMILSKWPQLTGQDAGDVILNTSRDIGEEGTDEIYGRGLIDVQAALSPVDPTLSNGKASSSINSSVMVVGGAFGGGGYGPASFEGAFEDITVLDAYGRDYTGDVSGLVVRPGGSDNNWLRRRLVAHANAGSTGFVGTKISGVVGYSAVETEHRDANGEYLLDNRLTNAAFAYRLGDGISVTAGYNTSDNVMDNIGLAPTSDAMFAYSPLAQTNVGISQQVGEGRLSLTAYAGRQQDTQTNGITMQWSEDASSLKLGLVDEIGVVFGTAVGAGAMRFGDGARTVFLEAATGIDIGSVKFDGYASLGATQLKISDDTLLTNADTIASGRFGFTASRQMLGGLVSFGVAQDLVALSGDATFTVGNGYSLEARDLTYEDRNVSMRGSIEPQLTFGYSIEGERSAFRLGASSDTSGRDVRALATYRIQLK